MGTVCRQSSGECDLEEYCTGESGECPEDLFFKNGISCKNGAGYCYKYDVLKTSFIQNFCLYKYLQERLLIKNKIL